MTAPFRIEALGPAHDRDAFSCGTAALDHYLAKQARQDMKRRVCACFVAGDIATGRIAGYYTLSAGGVALVDLPAGLARRLPRYPSVPVARIGRLAVDQAFQGRSLGGALLVDAAMRALRSEVAVHALVVDAKDDRAVAFYRHHGFSDFGDAGRQLIVSLKRFAELEGH